MLPSLLNILTWAHPCPWLASVAFMDKGNEEMDRVCPCLPDSADCLVSWLSARCPRVSSQKCVELKWYKVQTGSMLSKDSWRRRILSSRFSRYDLKSEMLIVLMCLAWIELGRTTVNEGKDPYPYDVLWDFFSTFISMRSKKTTGSFTNENGSCSRENFNHGHFFFTKDKSSIVQFSC